jgi:hypothetical protein
VGTTENDPGGRLRVKCVDGSPIDNLGVIEAAVRAGNKLFVHGFQLVNKQVDIPCDGILCRDFFRRTRAKML